MLAQFPSAKIQFEDPKTEPPANRNRGIVHSAVRGHERIAEEVSHHQVQVLDADGISALVGRGLVGIGNLRPLVRTALVSKVNLNIRTTSPK
jgi:hypothetical protein